MCALYIGEPKTTVAFNVFPLKAQCFCRMTISDHYSPSQEESMTNFSDIISEGIYPPTPGVKEVCSPRKGRRRGQKLRVRREIERRDNNWGWRNQRATSRDSLSFVLSSPAILSFLSLSWHPRFCPLFCRHPQFFAPGTPLDPSPSVFVPLLDSTPHPQSLHHARHLACINDI